MILVDSSVWIDYLRGGQQPTTDRLRRLVDTRLDELATCEPVVMEILAGCSPAQLGRVERLLDGLASLAVDPHIHYRHAAAIYRAVRASGHTVRALNDCLIAAVALGHDAELLHKDADFERIAAVTALRSTPLSDLPGR